MHNMSIIKVIKQHDTDFYGYELLLLKRLQIDRTLWNFLGSEWLSEMKNDGEQETSTCHLPSNMVSRLGHYHYMYIYLLLQILFWTWLLCFWFFGSQVITQCFFFFWLFNWLLVSLVTSSDTT